MSPLPGYKVIPDGWSAHHRPTANATMTAACTISRALDGPPSFPLPEDWSGEATVWPPEGQQGLCRLQELNRAGTALPGEQPTQLRDYLAVLPVEVLDIVRAGENGDTLNVAGRRYKIQQAMHGSQLWEADLICQDNQTQQNP